jgi:hypothetical protein
VAPLKPSHPADFIWIETFVRFLVFEFSHEDLLSYSWERWRAKHPILVALLWISLGGHFGGLLPRHFDILHADNRLHILIKRLFHAYSDHGVRLRVSR